MDIYIDVKKQRLQVKTEQTTIVDGTKNFIYFVFDLSKEWKGLTVSAQFIQGDTVYTSVLDENDTVVLPDGLELGDFTLSLIGEGDSTIATSGYITFKNIESIYIS